MSLSLADLLAQNKAAIVQEIARTVKEKAGPPYAAMSLEELLPHMEQFFGVMYRAVARQDLAVLEELIEGMVRQRAQERYEVGEIQTVLSAFRAAVLGVMDGAYQDDPQQHIASLRQIEELTHHTRERVFGVYLDLYNEYMGRQRRVLAELSTPVIRVYENVLVLPLIGAIDTERAHRIMEELLLGITHHQAELVIIDITGVPLVDTAVANHLVQTIKAARLLGARSILVGISSDVAQSLVHLQIDLSGVVTRSNLQAGIEYALEQMGLEIVPQVEAPLEGELHKPEGELVGGPGQGTDRR